MTAKEGVWLILFDIWGFQRWLLTCPCDVNTYPSRHIIRESIKTQI